MLLGQAIAQFLSTLLALAMPFQHMSACYLVQFVGEQHVFALTESVPGIDLASEVNLVPSTRA